MKYFIVLAVTICAAQAYSPFKQAASAVYSGQNVEKVFHSDEKSAPILRSESNVHPEGFNFEYETGNGISADASGALKKVDQFEAVAVQGSYRYTSPEGVPFVLSYVADETGYHPQGDHLPTPPPIPASILRSLEFIAAHPPPQEPTVFSQNRRF